MKLVQEKYPNATHASPPTKLMAIYKERVEYFHFNQLKRLQAKSGGGQSHHKHRLYE